MKKHKIKIKTGKMNVRINGTFIVLLMIDLVLVTAVLIVLLKWYGAGHSTYTMKAGIQFDVREEDKCEACLIMSSDDLPPSECEGAFPQEEDKCEACLIMSSDDLPPSECEGAFPQHQEIMLQAERLAQSYDYDGAVRMLQTIEGYEEDAGLLDKIHSYETAEAACVPVNMEEVTHVFYHSLVVDPKRAFANQETDHQAAGNNQWMTTISEFEKIIQEMYDRGYVIVGIHDLFDITTDENGGILFQPANIMLPPGKRAYVLSQDDLSYYHCYDNYGYAAKMVLDENGKPVCEYIQADGTRLVGAYDIVPILDAFIEEHPDASYRGAKGVIALTGYNGILGYRTDNSYLDVTENTNQDKKEWLKQHPDFDIEKERMEAKRVAEALKEDGWEFASHTWGHIKVGESSLERIMRDTWKWRENVEPLVGATDIIVFAHGQDLGEWGDYDEYDERYQYYREQGYRIFCNVDSNLYRTWFGRDYLRAGRRNLDGYRIYNNAIGSQDNVSDLFDAAAVIDPLRPPVLPLE